MNRQSTDRLRLFEVANLHRPSRALIGSHLFETTRLGLCRLALHLDARLAISRRKKCLAINPVARPAIWGESGVSMMNSMPDPPYKISRNFKLQSCGPNLYVEQ